MLRREPVAVRRGVRADAEHRIQHTAFQYLRRRSLSPPAFRPPSGQCGRCSAARAPDRAERTESSCRAASASRAAPAARTDDANRDRSSAHREKSPSCPAPAPWRYRRAAALRRKGRAGVAVRPRRHARDFHRLEHGCLVGGAQLAGKSQIREPPVRHRLRTVMAGTLRTCAGNAASCANALREYAPIGRPSIRISPPLSGSCRAAARSSVVFPHPFGPISVVIWPCGAVKLTSCNMF